MDRIVDCGSTDLGSTPNESTSRITTPLHDECRGVVILAFVRSRKKLPVYKTRRYDEGLSEAAGSRRLVFLSAQHAKNT